MNTTPEPVSRLARIMSGLRRRPAEPTIAELAASFAAANVRWAAGGFKVTSREVYQARVETCGACPHWEAAARFGLGRCSAPGCGCTRFKRWLATEKCPLGKWRE